MDVTIIMKVIGVGVIVSVAYQILSRAGRDEQAMLVSLTGVVIVLLMLIGEIARLFSTIRSIFGL